MFCKSLRIKESAKYYTNNHNYKNRPAGVCELCWHCLLQTNRNKICFKSKQNKYNYVLFSEGQFAKFLNVSHK